MSKQRETKSATLHLRLSAAERAALEAEARRLGKGLSDVARQAITNATNNPRQAEAPRA